MGEKDSRPVRGQQRGVNQVYLREDCSSSLLETITGRYEAPSGNALLLGVAILGTLGTQSDWKPIPGAARGKIKP